MWNKSPGLALREALLGPETVCFSRVQSQFQRLASSVWTDLGFPALSPEQHGNPEEGLQVWAQRAGSAG